MIELKSCDISCQNFQEPMEGKQEAAGDLHFVGKKDELIEAKRSCRTIEGRDVLIAYHQGVFYAVDAYCYREYVFINTHLKCLVPLRVGKKTIVL